MSQKNSPTTYDIQRKNAKDSIQNVFLQNLSVEIHFTHIYLMVLIFQFICIVIIHCLSVIQTYKTVKKSKSYREDQSEGEQPPWDIV